MRTKTRLAANIAARMCALITVAVLCAAAARAEAEDDPFKDLFFPPELVMQNQASLNLTEEQKNFFKTEFRQAQTNFTELQWKLQDEMEKLLALIKQPNLNEQATLAALDKVLNAERDIKRLQFQLVVRIKNHLTQAQQSQLAEIQKKARGK